MGACYEHLSYVERIEIGRRLCRAASTISRELKLKRMGPYWRALRPRMPCSPRCAAKKVMR